MEQEVGHALLSCWGKIFTQSPEATEFHPAIFHMLDAANVARVILEQASTRWRKVLSTSLVCREDQLVAWLPWVVGLHDTGKFSSSFQQQDKSQAERLHNEGLRFGPTGNRCIIP